MEIEWKLELQDCRKWPQPATIFFFFYTRGRKTRVWAIGFTAFVPQPSIPGMTTNVIDELMGVVMGCALNFRARPLT